MSELKEREEVWDESEFRRHGMKRVAWGFCFLFIRNRLTVSNSLTRVTHHCDWTVVLGVVFNKHVMGSF